MPKQTERRSPTPPFFSICVPQHNRTGLLIEALKVVEQQTFKDVEVCISDDCSSDGRQQEIIKFLENSTLFYVFKPTERNLRYDGNLRSAIGLALGRYCILMGNDDCLKSRDTLGIMNSEIISSHYPGVLIGNFEDWATGNVTRRIRINQLLPGNSHTAVMNYRNLAFVSGLTVDRQAAQSIATERWDGSEMYQMFVFCRVIAQGRALLTLDQPLTRKDIQMEGEFVDSYAKWERLIPCPIIERRLPFCKIGQVVADAVAPFLPANVSTKELSLIFEQLYYFTYPFWLFEYRRVQSWNYSAGLCLGIRPSVVVGTLPLGWRKRMWLRLLWFSSSLFGLLTPIAVFDAVRHRLYTLSRSFGI